MQELDVALQEKPKGMNDEDWNKINGQACATIHSCLAKGPNYSVLKETSAKKLWKSLGEKYKRPSLESRFHLWKKLLHFKYQPRISMNDHISTKLSKVLVALACLGKNIEDEDKVLLFVEFPPGRI